MRTYELMRIGGIAVRLHPTFVGLALVIAVSTLTKERTFGAALLQMLVPALLFFTVLWHEFGHVVAAKLLGVPVIDIVLTPLGGQARLYSLHERPREEWRIAAAGPLANLLVAVPMLIGFMIFEPNTPPVSRFVLLPPDVKDPRAWASLTFSFHLLLGTLNLLPIFPMDGGRILRALLAGPWGVVRATRFACRIGTFAALTMIAQPFLMPDRALWILVFAGLFLLWTGFIERLTVEKDALFKSGRVVFRGFRVGPNGVEPMDASDVFGTPREERKPELDDPNVLDVKARSRLLDE